MHRITTLIAIVTAAALATGCVGSTDPTEAEASLGPRASHRGACSILPKPLRPRAVSEVGLTRIAWEVAFRSLTPHRSFRRMKALIEFTERFGNMLSRTLLTVLYFLVLGPFAIVYRLVTDPLHLKPRPSGNWSAWQATNETLSAARRQD